MNWGYTWVGDTALVVGIKDKPVNVVRQFKLNQNYPNPFNPTTTISYSIAKSGKVRIDIYNLLGEKVAELVNKVQQPGDYQIKFDGSNLASGMYFYRISSQNFTQIKKMILFK
ncbi:MAG: T9SS type A sorting domain-containing protein [Calditrichia bacterium]